MLFLILVVLTLAFYLIYYIKFQRRKRHIDNPEKRNYICPYCDSSLEDRDLILCPYCFKPLIKRCKSCGEWTFLRYKDCQRSGENPMTLIEKSEKA